MQNGKSSKEGNTLTVDTLGDLLDLEIDKDVDKIIVCSGIKISSRFQITDPERFFFGKLRENLKNIKEIQIQEPGTIFARDNMIFYRQRLEGADKLVLALYLGKEKDIIIPEGVNTIGNGAFKNAEMRSVIFPDVLSLYFLV